MPLRARGLTFDDRAAAGQVFGERLDGPLLERLNDPTLAERAFDAFARVVTARKPAMLGPLHIDVLLRVLDEGPEPWRATAAFSLGELGVLSARDRLRKVALDPSESEGTRLSASSCLAATSLLLRPPSPVPATFSAARRRAA